jgi:uncharacterized protein DUF1592/uncharacterized protein DUF1588/uncharacterized protein DUF1595/uncharacterized protein DUF1585/uncharacterized protein DUF1587
MLTKNPVLLAGALALSTAVGLGACAGDDDLFPDPTPPPEKPVVVFEPAGGGLRRLLARQYIASIRVMLGDVAADAADPPDDAQLSGLDAIGASELPIPPAAFEKYEQSARAVAAAAVGDAATKDRILTPCSANDADAACFGKALKPLARLAWRRTPTSEEVNGLVHAATVGADAYQTLDGGLEAGIATALLSPYFLYIVELGQPIEGEKHRRKLAGTELATRMSMFVLGQTPDAALLDLAEGGDLDDPAVVRQTAEDLVARPEAKSALRAFYSEAFRLREIDEVTKDGELYPEFTGDLRASMKEEALRLIDSVVWEDDGDALDILDAPYTFVDGRLAALYGVDAPASGTWAEVTLPDQQERAGILSQAVVMARFAHPAQTSPTKRGLFIQRAVLCTDIPPPPADVNPVLPPDDGAPKTLKQKLVEVHEKQEVCGSCHKQMDSIGFAFERFDPIGAFRTEDQNGLTLDATGEIQGFGSWDGPAELAAVLRADPRAPECMVKNLFRQALGHMETDGELPAVNALAATFGENGHRVRGLLVELVTSDVFAEVGDPR